MREKLFQYIKKRFGLTYGSRELRAARAEITQNALARYDEEIANGASEDAAYGIAVDSLGDMNDLLKEYKIPKKKRIRGLAITIPLTLLLAVLAVIPFILSLTAYPQLSSLSDDISSGLNSIILTLALSFILPPVLLGFGMISLACGTRRKVLSIVSMCLGAAAFVPQLIFLLLALILFGPSKKTSFDFRKDMENIKSIEIVEIQNTAWFEDDYEYRVESEIAPGEWDDFLSRLSELNYTYPSYGSPPELHKGNKAILIRFDHSIKGKLFVLIGKFGCGYGTRADSRVKVIDDRCLCKDQDGFDSLLDDYR